MTIYTQTEYERLRKAYAAGVLRVQYEDRTVTYPSRAEMRALLTEMEQGLGLTTARGGRLRSTYQRGT